jgi:hypothetical protein
MKALKIITALSVGFGVGVFSALWMSGIIGGKTLDSFADVKAGNWRSDWSIGAPSADPYLRARIARHGLLALSKQEAVYFNLSADDQGAPLREICQYALSGGKQDALWWSITLYDSGSRLPMNTDNALSIDATKVGAAENWTSVIASEKPAGGGHWLSSRNAGQFDLTMRIYRPTQAVLDAPETRVNPPQLRRLSCRDGSGT